MSDEPKDDGGGAGARGKDRLSDRLAGAARGVGEALRNDELPPLLDRPDLKARFVAALIDGAIGLAVIFVSFVVGLVVGNFTVTNVAMMTGAILATAFMAARDGISGSRSPGKRAVGLRVVDDEGHLIGISGSLRRNRATAAPFAAVVLYGALNLASDLLRSVGTLVGALAMVAALGYLGWECYELLRDRDESRRPGDRAAGTRVVEVDED